MADTGWLHPSTFVEQTDVGDFSQPRYCCSAYWMWTDVNSNQGTVSLVQSSNADGIWAEMWYGDLGGGAQENPSNTGRFTNFGASIPGGSTITGVEVAVVHKAYGVYGEWFNKIQIEYGDGSNLGDNKYNQFGSPIYPSYASYGSTTFGGTSDAWSLSLTPTIVNATDFGVDIQCTTDNPNNPDQSQWIEIDELTIRITYTAGGGGGPDGSAFLTL